MTWKVEKLVDSVCQAVCSGGYGKEAVRDFLMHLAIKVYNMDRESIPITDLTHIPEVFERTKDRWVSGVCN